MESIEREFVSYEIAVQMKELGFDEECFSYYDLRNKPNFFGRDNLMDTHCVQVNRPTYSQCFRWFRKKKYHSGIIPYYDYYYFIIKDFNKGPEYNSRHHFESDDLVELSFEEAETECLKKLIELCQNQI